MACHRMAWACRTAFAQAAWPAATSYTARSPKMSSPRRWSCWMNGLW